LREERVKYEEINDDNNFGEKIKFEPLQMKGEKFFIRRLERN
jgi:hypothetical protein